MSTTPLTTFLRANLPYWFHLPGYEPERVRLVKLDVGPLRNGTSTHSMASLRKLGFPSEDTGQADVYVGDSVIVVAAHQSGLFSPRHRESESILKTWGRAVAERFRSHTKSALIKNLAKGGDDRTDNLLAAFKDYTFFSGYSVWLFNDITRTFTRIAGNVPTERDYFPEESCPMLSALLGETRMTCTTAEERKVPDAVPDGLVWCNAFSVSTASSEIAPPGFTACVILYTEYNGYDLRAETAELFRSHLQENLADRYFDRLTGINTFRAASRTELSLDAPEAFLRDFAEGICSNLSWESCSIFLRDERDQTSLLCKAVHPETAKARSMLNKSYSVLQDSMTAGVYRSGEMSWSYDIENDPRNTHTVDDPTETVPRNWIGVPLKTHGGTNFGVLRVKNHRAPPGTNEFHFCSLDIHNLQTVCAEIAGVLHHCDVFLERKKLAEERTRELSELQDFLRTFRHEIRSPIQAVCFAPERLALIMKSEGIITPEEVPKKLREFLADFKATGNRMEMISKALTLSPEDIVQDIVPNNLFKDCVAPVLAFSTPYAAKKKRDIFVGKDSLLVNMDCDSTAVQMAFHVLVDNAIKYSDRGTVIRIYGERIAGGHQVVVESRSRIFRIEPRDEAHIREKSYRGRKAIEQKLEGSGIGLFLADRIMQLHHGELAILRKSAPVRFALKFRN